MSLENKNLLIVEGKDILGSLPQFVKQYFNANVIGSEYVPVDWADILFRQRIHAALVHARLSSELDSLLAGIKTGLPMVVLVNSLMREDISRIEIIKKTGVKTIDKQEVVGGEDLYYSALSYLSEITK